MNKIIYLDSHATTPVDKRVLEKMLPFFSEKFGNASSTDHVYGNEVLKDIKESRENISRVINAEVDDIFFTSGATESDNLALLGIAEQYKDKGKHIITSKIEHKAVLESCVELENRGFEVTYLDVDEKGYIFLEDLEKSIREDTILVSIIAANNEIGTIQDLNTIGKICSNKGVLFHTDAAQAFSNIKLDVKKMNIHLMSISGHKIYGPKGIGALYVRKTENPRVKIKSQMFGGGQESKIRPGTYNVPSIVGLGEAAKISNVERKDNEKLMRKLKIRLFEKLNGSLDVKVNGDLENSLAHNLNLYFEGIEAKAILNLIKNEVAVSAGSACTTENVNASHVLLAIGCDIDRAFGSLRFGITKYTTEEEIDRTADVIIKTVKKLNMFN